MLRLTPATVSEVPKPVELEHRITRLELLVKELREDLAIRQRTETAIQAQLDHLTARFKEHQL